MAVHVNFVVGVIVVTRLCNFCSQIVMQCGLPHRTCRTCVLHEILSVDMPWLTVLDVVLVMSLTCIGHLQGALCTCTLGEYRNCYWCLRSACKCFSKQQSQGKVWIHWIRCYESWVVPAGVPSALADTGGGVEANYWLSQRKGGGGCFCDKINSWGGGGGG